MEFQEALMRLMVHKKSSESTETTRSPRHRWKISFYRSSSSITAKTQQQEPKKMLQTPKEFLCPISGSLMADPVIVSSGHTFERACVHACKTLGFTPALVDGTAPDFSTVIPNLALKSTILNWCEKNSVSPPKPIDILSADKLVCTLMATTHKKEENEEKELIRGLKENPSLNFSHAVTDLTRRPGKFFAISSEVSVPTTATVPTTPPLQLATRPSCYSSASSSELETSTPHPQPNSEEEFVAKLKSQQVHELEEAVISLRKITRTREDSRATLCTTRLLSALRSLIISRYTNIQVNSVAALVNLSLEKANKVKIVRSGIVPPLIEVLKGGSLEAQEHACGAIFSLSLDDNNKTAIGVLGALPPLLHLLRSESERTRHDSALALYHLSLVRSNRTKLVKLGSVNVLLGMVKSGQMVGRVLIILGNLAACPDGRVALLDSGGVECMSDMLRDYSELNESTRTSCVNVLYGLSHGGLRFRGLAKVGGMAETLRTVERGGNQQAREKARRILEMMKGRGDEEEEEEDMDWQELLESGLTSRTRFGPSTGRSESIVNSSEF
ncbi:U-box domain-containing protein 40-like [Pistacia vera]|uniref:U-box domain-containing protein 40-like n=1 Tax=Pistacia vera TaxID=55513 RepID=UPI001263DD6D|nr:U-box domain-containing protein 40-like [Pistacia vera]XP_031274626.1 U-box domain-containing protein 40-like [Pistacia vera]